MLFSDLCVALLLLYINKMIVQHSLLLTSVIVAQERSDVADGWRLKTTFLGGMVDLDHPFLMTYLLFCRVKDD